MALCVFPMTLMNMTTREETTEEDKQFNMELDDLLQQYNEVFQEPKTLPPHRKHDHQIILKDESLPTNVRPYRNPPTQKDAIEKMVKELLASGVIRPSRSPFSSPIVMVKKKDGSWRMCIDYRQLNNNIVKDKFPIYNRRAY